MSATDATPATNDTTDRTDATPTPTDATPTPTAANATDMTRRHHPARYSRELIPVIADMLRKLPDGSRILDPMAGTGERLAELDVATGNRFRWEGIEIEPVWIVRNDYVRYGDATSMTGVRDDTYDAIVVSPTYGNGMNDYFRAGDMSARNTYIHRARARAGTQELEFSEFNTSRYHFGTDGYNRLHLEAWAECARVLKPRGRFILNTKNGIGKARRGGRNAADMSRVTEWHIEALGLFGFVVVDQRQVPVRGLRQGANADIRVDHEDVTMLRLMP